MTTLGLRDLGFVAASSGVLWTPALITTALWLDAADDSTITQSSNLVSQINDKSGNGRNFTASSTAMPTLTSNGLNARNVLTFSGSQYLTSVNINAIWRFLHDSTGSTLVAVWKAGNSSNPNAVYGLIGNSVASSLNTGFSLFFDDRTSVPRNEVIAASAVRGTADTFAYTNASLDGAHPPNTSVLLSHVGDPANGTAANRSTIRVNGGIPIGNNTFTNSASSNDATYNLQIGSAGNASSLLVGYIAEIILISGVTSTIIRQRLEGYLAWKWNLVANLPSDHPYKSTPPTV